MQPLRDTTVLGFTQSVAGPTCTQLLSMLGAEVVKVEPPWGDSGRNQVNGAQFASFNRGAKCLCVDLKTDRGREIVADLAADADVIVENYRPGVLAELGLGFEDVAERNTDVVYCSISGFGESGPYRDHAAYDPIVQSVSGLLSVTGHPDARPVRIGTSALDWTTGMTGAYTILGALLERVSGRDPGPIHLDVSLFDVAISWMAYWIGLYTETGEVKKNVGNSIFDTAPYGLYHAADGPFLLCAGNTYMQFEKLCRAIGREDLLEDERYESREGRWANRDELREELERTFGEYRCDDLVDLLTEAGVAVGAIQDVDDVADRDPHVAAREMLVETVNPTTGGRLRTAGPPFRVNGEATDADGPPRDLGADAEEILAMYGFTSDEVEVLVEAGVLHREATESSTHD